MAKRTKKVGPTGRFGTRYGVRSRVRWREIENRQKSKHTCPACGHAKVTRLSTSIWSCRKCGIKFTGGAYVPRTDAALGVDKSIAGVLEKVRSGEAEETPDVDEMMESKEA
jgi:large subunit ribosomal protein L37Ae